jgi:hypothetical protein
MDKLKTTFTRLDPAELPKRPRSLDQLSDEDIRTADGLMLVDPDQPDWQRLLWSAPIADGMATSMMMRIVEIAVDSRDESQIEAARRRVGKLKKVEKLH